MRRMLPIALMLAVSLAACSSYDEGVNSGAGGANGGYGAGGPGAGGPGSPGYGSTAAPGSEEDLVQAVGDRIFFDTDQSTLNAQASATLDKQAAWLQRYPTVSIVVAGNCDERGTEEYNLALGQRRANVDRDYLIAHGVNAARVRTISYGKDRPTDPNSGPESWAKNRNAITMVQ